MLENLKIQLGMNNANKVISINFKIEIRNIKLVN